MGRLTTTFMRAYGISCGGVTRCTPAAPTASVSKRCSASWEYCNSAESRGSLVRESAVKPVGKPDALIGHVRFDERGWETGRRSGVSARAHPRLYPLPSTRLADSRQGEANAVFRTQLASAQFPDGRRSASKPVHTSATANRGLSGLTWRRNFRGSQYSRTGAAIETIRFPRSRPSL